MKASEPLTCVIKPCVFDRISFQILETLERLLNCDAILPILWAESLVDNELLIVEVVLFNDSEMSFVGNTNPIRRACGNVFGLFE